MVSTGLAIEALDSCSVQQFRGKAGQGEAQQSTQPRPPSQGERCWGG